MGDGDKQTNYHALVGAGDEKDCLLGKVIIFSLMTPTKSLESY